MELETARGSEKGAANVPSDTGKSLAALRRSEDGPSPGSRTLFPEIEKLLARPAGH
jgi:hypothetical protein